MLEHTCQNWEPDPDYEVDPVNECHHGIYRGGMDCPVCDCPVCKPLAEISDYDLLTEVDRRGLNEDNVALLATANRMKVELERILRVRPTGDLEQLREDAEAIIAKIEGRDTAESPEGWIA